MIAASIWSLLLPAMEYESSKAFGRLSFLPALIGLWLGIGFMFIMERNVPSSESNGLLKKNMLFWSVSLHNLPEGMAVGVLYAAVLRDNAPHMLSAAFALSIGIAIQNFPEGAKNLKEIYLSKSVETIGEIAFARCPSLQNIYYEGSEADYKKINIDVSNDSFFRKESETVDPENPENEPLPPLEISYNQKIKK